MQINLPRDVRFILRKIKKAGHEAFAVGGCVRDSLIGAAPQDWDITTSMLPRDSAKLFPRTFGTGLAHGTVTVVMTGTNYEVTTYRVDGEYFDSRRPSSVTFTRNIEDDLARRDFTINAMAYNDERGLVDMFGGKEDLERKMIRAVGDPRHRFTEDALRMLRAVRFAARLGFRIEDETFRAAADLKDRLSLISAERVREELVKLLMSPYPQTGVLLETSGMMPYVLRGREYKGDLRGALRRVAKCPAHTAMRAALFFHGFGNEVETLLRALRFDNKTIRETATYARMLDVEIAPDAYSIKKHLAVMPSEWFFNLLTLQGETEQSPVRRIAEDILANGDCVRIGDLKIDGGDLIAAGIPPGKAVGEALLFLLDEAHKNPAVNTKENLPDLLKRG